MCPIIAERLHVALKQHRGYRAERLGPAQDPIDVDGQRRTIVGGGDVKPLPRPDRTGLCKNVV